MDPQHSRNCLVVDYLATLYRLISYRVNLPCSLELNERLTLLHHGVEGRVFCAFLNHFQNCVFTYRQWSRVDSIQMYKTMYCIQWSTV